MCCPTVDCHKGPNANWTNSIGASELATVWTDPSFDPKQKAFYYARVTEIPTPRWSTYDAFRFGIDLPKDRQPVSSGTPSVAPTLAPRPRMN